eukprot:1149254-Pelagomonas_calceolata.AAC.5
MGAFWEPGWDRFRFSALPCESMSGKEAEDIHPMSKVRSTLLGIIVPIKSKTGWFLATRKK